MVNFTKQYNNLFSQNPVLDGSQINAGEELFQQLEPEIRQNPNTIRSIVLEILQNSINAVSEKETLNRVHNDLDRSDNELLQDISFIAGINMWQSKGNLQEAKKRIIEAYRLKSPSLHLNQLGLHTLPKEIGRLTSLTNLELFFNQLQSLPPEIGELTWLTELDLSKNQLESLPAEIVQLTSLISLDLAGNRLQSLPVEIGQLTNLTELDLAENQLQSLPPEIGQLTSLTELDLASNQLQSLPSEIGQLTLLTVLHLNNNQLQSLPAEIGQLTSLTDLPLWENKLQSIPVQLGNLRNLREFNIRNNPELQELPLSLGNCNLTFIICEGTRIGLDQRDAILNLCRQNRANQSAIQLTQKIELWKTFAKSNFNFDLSVLQYEQRVDLYEWLTRLERTKDFSQSQTNLTKIVCKILETVLTDPEFRELFFVQVKANNECCEDRAAMSLNEIFTSWKIHTLPQDAPLKEKLSLLTGLSKTLSLRTQLGKLIGNQAESVEIYLYYETALREPLQLITAIESMVYQNIGEREWIDKKKLISDVDKHFFDELFPLPVFKKIYEQDPVLLAELHRINEEHQKEIDKLEEPNLQWLTDEEKEDATLVHGARMGEIMSHREEELKAKTKEWYEQQMRGLKRKFKEVG